MISVETAVRLALTHGITIRKGCRWDLVMYFRQMAKDRPESIVKAMWGDWKDDQRENGYWGLPDINKESTYEDCVLYDFDFESKQLTVIFLKGDMCYGRPINGPELSWTFQLQDTDKVWTKWVIPYVESRMSQLATDIYTQRKLEEEQMQINAIYQELTK